METTYIVVAVAIAVLAFVLFRFLGKPKALPEPEEKSAPPKKSLAPAPAREAEKKPESKPKAPKGPLPVQSKKADEPAKASPVVPREEVSQAEPIASSDLLAASPARTRTHKRDVQGVRKGLTASRGGFIARLAALITGKKEIDPNIVDQVEEVLLSADVGAATTEAFLSRIREGLSRNELRDGDAVWAALKKEAARILSAGDEGDLLRTQKPTVVLVVGVNGVGKTTTIGKLSTHYVSAGKRVLLAAGDTFRAAAVAQLEIWGKRVGADVLKGKDGADPGAVAFDATLKAKEEGYDVVFVDTAGRLHTKVPLMDEIRKVRKTIAKAYEGAPHETLLVLDATTGQNALAQAKLFKEAVEPTGIVLTKLDGTAKGGIVLGICDELKIPVRFIGLGERAEDLREFCAEEFVDALFDARDQITENS